MIFTLLKILLFVAAVAALAWTAIWLSTYDEFARVEVFGVDMMLSALQLVIASVLVIIAVWAALMVGKFLIALFKFLNGDDTAISRYFSRNREKRGVNALTQAMMALAAGDGSGAMAKAKKADRLLDNAQLTNLMTAQAAQLAGDQKAAQSSYKKMLEDPETRFVGICGILQQKLAEGDSDTALKLAERAFALKSNDAQTQDILLRLQAESGDWSGARKTLGQQLKSGHIPRDLHRRRDAVLALEEARSLSDPHAREQAAIEANRLSPTLIPAAIEAAKGHIRTGYAAQATRILQKAWAAEPHPELAATFAQIVPDETPEARIKRFKPFFKQEGHPEVKMLKAELYIAAEDFPEARRAMGDLPFEHPTARALTIMAAIARGEGEDDAVVRGWLMKAAVAPRGPQWICTQSNTPVSEWASLSPICGAFDSIAWRELDGEAVAAAPLSGEFLSLVSVPAQVEDTADVVIVEPEAEQAAAK